MKNLIKKTRFLFEYIIVKILFFILSLLPIKAVSIIGGKIFKLFGPFSKYNNIAISNYKKIFPLHSKKQIHFNIKKSWENIGKTIFEISILKKLVSKKNNKIHIEGFSNINKFLKKNKSVIFFGIHQSNWEICVPIIDQLGFNVGAIYRHINNRYIDKIVLNKRTGSLITKNSFYTPKGKKSAKDILEAVKKNKSVFLLIDQKDSAGEDINFFDYKVKSQVGFLKIAKKYQMPLIPIQNIRKKDDSFSIIFHKSVELNSKNIEEAILMQKIHKIVEKWIISEPSQWFWQHNRFN
tara:strand:+ start:971 stop:1852 length:882 start_codon:yes stop_codon:yes gene_type:complete